jgi:hypothetical protein
MKRAQARGRAHGERGIGLVELVVGLGIAAMVMSTLGMTLVAVIKNTAFGRDQQSATHALRDGLFWLNQDTQSAVAGASTIGANDVVLAWTDASTGTAYHVHYVQAGSELQRTITTDGGTPSTRVVARGVASGGFTASQTGLTVTYGLEVQNGSGTQQRSETVTMRVSLDAPTPFATVTAAATSTPTTAAISTATATPTPTRTNTPTPTRTNTPVPTATATNTPTVTSSPTPASTCGTSDSGYLSPSANAADSGGDGDGFESNADLAYADGGGNATNLKGDGDRHRYYNYGISVPDGCSFAGIEVRSDYSVKNNGGTTTLAIALSWDGGSTWTPVKSDSSEPLVEATKLVGSPVDTWGHAWSPSDLDNGSFRIRVTMTLGNGGQEVYLDWLAVRVYFQ